ncbi:MAG: hypothetical protein NC418_08655 [Muribaculaceae bacterium]|nr:hypothetical protein [Muribaculaceae bacterium]
MNALRFLIFSLGISSAAYSLAADIEHRIMAYDTLFNAPSRLALANAALIPMQHDVSLSHAMAGFDRRNTGSELVFGIGTGAGAGFFEAASYMKYGRSTITGKASYSNGKRFGVQYCDVSDPAVVFPYFTADELGGNYSSESYIFEGTYSSDFKSGTWLYGAGLAYRALQEYRKADPRPKNTVGDLSLKAGLGRRLGGYILALGADVAKYRQSSDVIFVSETGEVPVYHLTGMGSHYARFAGQGKASLYTGNRQSYSLSLFPTGKDGYFATAQYTFFTLTKSLKDLNNLPLKHIREHKAEAEIGWRSAVLSTGLDFCYRKRLGGESIFGDASGNVYPELFTLAAYSYSTLSVGASACYRHVLPGKQRFEACLSAGYFHSSEVYAGVSPRLRSTASRITAAVKCEYVRLLSRRWLISAHAGVSKDAVGLLAAGGGAGADYIFGKRALGIAAEAQALNASGGSCGYRIKTAIVFKF